MVIPEPALCKNSLVPLTYTGVFKVVSHGPECVTGQGVGVPKGGELGRGPSCLDVPVQEWVWAHKRAGVYVFEHMCGCVQCTCPRCCPCPPERPGQILSSLGLGFPICRTVGGFGAPGTGRCPGIGTMLSCPAPPISVVCPASSHLCLLFLRRFS